MNSPVETLKQIINQVSYQLPISVGQEQSMFTKKTFLNILLILGILSAFVWSQQAEAKIIDFVGLATTNTDPVIGRPFNISIHTVDEVLPAVAYNPVDREYLVVWENLRPTVANDIYAQRISEQGQFLSWFAIAEGENPSVAYNPKNNSYLVTYTIYAGSDYDVYAQRVDYTGPFGNPIPVAFNLNENEANSAVAYNTHPLYDQFLVVWETITAPPAVQYKVEGMRVAGTEVSGGKQTIGGRIPVATDANYYFEPDVAYNLNMNEYLVVFTRQPGGGGEYDIYGRRVTRDGDPLPPTGPITIDGSPQSQYGPAVAAYRLNMTTPYLVVFSDFWNDTAGDVRGYLVDKEGNPNTLVNIATTPGLPELDPDIAQSESWDGYLVNWQQGSLGDYDIFGMRIRNDGYNYPAFDISSPSVIPGVCGRREPGIAAGDVSGLAVWVDPCGGAGGFDILGRMLGYQIYLPLAER